ncbi:interphotoreceptor matrix proteoglycan 2 [Leucoraja erinacea]|uniref:interphotoreceptor matrix proteoglycan 2 n=1 Tax=Leucoraja erinaceus TaxID=7782 RepID=UPI00245410D2|nr:interphotoreceptor matrix proteoglycan 2 [Leucoraja erinacea]
MRLQIGLIFFIIIFATHPIHGNNGIAAVGDGEEEDGSSELAESPSSGQAPETSPRTSALGRIVAWGRQRAKRTLFFPNGVKVCTTESMKQIMASHLEYYKLKVCQEAIWEAFRIFLDRIPEHKEYQHWVSICLQETHSPIEIGHQFSNSLEHISMLQQKLAIQSGDLQLSIPVDHGPTENSVTTSDKLMLTPASTPNIEISNEVVNETKVPVKDVHVTNVVPEEPSEHLVKFSVKLTDQNYSRELSDHNSQQYQELARRFEIQMQNLFEILPGFKGVQVLGFSVENDVLHFAAIFDRRAAAPSDILSAVLNIGSNKVENGDLLFESQEEVKLQDMVAMALFNDTSFSMDPTSLQFAEDSTELSPDSEDLKQPVANSAPFIQEKPGTEDDVGDSFVEWVPMITAEGELVGALDATVIDSASQTTQMPPGLNSGSEEQSTNHPTTNPSLIVPGQVSLELEGASPVVVLGPEREVTEGILDIGVAMVSVIGGLVEADEKDTVTTATSPMVPQQVEGHSDPATGGQGQEVSPEAQGEEAAYSTTPAAKEGWEWGTDGHLHGGIGEDLSYGGDIETTWSPPSAQPQHGQEPEEAEEITAPATSPHPSATGPSDGQGDDATEAEAEPAEGPRTEPTRPHEDRPVPPAGEEEREPGVGEGAKQRSELAPTAQGVEWAGTVPPGAATPDHTLAAANRLAGRSEEDDPGTMTAWTSPPAVVGEQADAEITDMPEAPRGPLMPLTTPAVSMVHLLLSTLHPSPGDGGEIIATWPLTMDVEGRSTPDVSFTAASAVPVQSSNQPSPSGLPASAYSDHDGGPSPTILTMTTALPQSATGTTVSEPGEEEAGSTVEASGGEVGLLTAGDVVGHQPQLPSATPLNPLNYLTLDQLTTHSPKELVVFFSLRVTNMMFSEDLFNKSSPEYRMLEQQFLHLVSCLVWSHLFCSHSPCYIGDPDNQECNPGNISEKMHHAQPAAAAYEAELNVVTQKLPTLWTLQPGVWFRQVESQFHVRGVMVDKTRYDYVVSALNQDTAGWVVPCLDNPPVVGKYAGLRIFGPSCMDSSRGELRRSAVASGVHRRAVAGRRWVCWKPWNGSIQHPGRHSDPGPCPQEAPWSRTPGKLHRSQGKRCAALTSYSEGSGPPMPPAMCVPGKLRSRLPVVTAVVGNIHRLYAWWVRRFLVDTGAEVNALPPSGVDTQTGSSGPKWAQPPCRGSWVPQRVQTQNITYPCSPEMLPVLLSYSSTLCLTFCKPVPAVPCVSGLILNLVSADQANTCKFQACDEHSECRVNKQTKEAQCVCYPGYVSVDGLPCQSVCSLRPNYCLNNGRCEMDPVKGAICRCHLGSDWLYRGRRCAELVSEPPLSTVTMVLCVFGALLLASVLTLLLPRLFHQLVKNKNRRSLHGGEVEGQASFNSGFEGDESLSVSHDHPQDLHRQPHGNNNSTTSSPHRNPQAFGQEVTGVSAKTRIHQLAVKHMQWEQNPQHSQLWVLPEAQVDSALSSLPPAEQNTETSTEVTAF